MPVRLPDVAPIVPRMGAMPADQHAWQFEMKYDGYRGLFYIEPDRCRIISKQRKPLPQFEHLCKSVGEALKIKSAILDGEIVVRDAARRPIFQNLHRRRGEPTYIAFDLLYFNGIDMRTLSLRQRRAQLETLVPADGTIVERSLAVQGSGDKFFQLMLKNDLEGIVAKRLADPYALWVKWRKIKNPDYSQAIGRSRQWRAAQ